MIWNIGTFNFQWKETQLINELKLNIVKSRFDCTYLERLTKSHTKKNQLFVDDL